MTTRTKNKENSRQEFAKMREALGKLRGVVEAWERNPKYNLHLLRSDQLKTDDWNIRFRKVFAFPKFPADAIRNYVLFLKKTGNLDPLVSFFNSLPGVDVNILEELQKDKGANIFVDQMLLSPHLGEIIEQKKQMIKFMTPDETLHQILERFRVKHGNIRWLQDAFYRWLTYINLIILNDLILFPGGHRDKDQLEKENVNPTGEVILIKKQYLKQKRQMGNIDASLLSDPEFIPKELKRIDSLIETYDRFIDLFHSLASARKPGRPIDSQLYTLLSSLSLSIPGGNLSSCRNEVVSLVYHLFPQTWLTDLKLIPAFNKYKSSPLGRLTLMNLQHL